MRLIFLPHYRPELNPAEHLRGVLREDGLANHVFRFRTLDAVEQVLCDGTSALENNAPAFNQ